MGLTKLAKHKGFKIFMSRLYGWGASIVILGALFKINHYAGADWLLVIGLTTESIIFFFSAFETPPVDPDWSLVYPELAHLYHPGQEGQRAGFKTSAPISKGASQELDKLLSDAKVGPELIESLGDGLRKFSENASQLAKLSDASVASDEFISTMKVAAESVNKLSQSSEKTSEILENDAEATQQFFSNVRNASEKVADLSAVYAEASSSIKSDLNASAGFSDALKKATESTNAIAEEYSKTADFIAKSAQALNQVSTGGEEYTSQLQKIAGNLSALNTVYEMQMKGLNDQIDSSDKLKGSIDQFLSNINETNQFMSNYKNEVDALTAKISALNNVYGNMLAAMNVSPK